MTHFILPHSASLTATQGPFASSVAVNEFKKQFKAKAGTNWENRVGMVAGKGKYTWLGASRNHKHISQPSLNDHLERSFEDDKDKDEEPSAKGKGKEKEEDEPIPDSLLHPEVQMLCRLIFSASYVSSSCYSRVNKYSYELLA